MSAAIRIIVLMCCFIALSNSFYCAITVRVTSKTEKKFKAVVIVPALRVQSLPMIFEGKGTKKVKINGEECGSQKWIFRTYKWKHDKWKPAKNITTKLQGTGWIRAVVGDDLEPHLTDRFGIACYDGTCA
ncbi:hypothetical protein GCK32_000016 [Trichostrongylus colubriformis]|uniref:Uncharacterized protein n=1 Tax=Trichostrongylus colubriformis TaxID=6319 RepID=A0AAN8FYW3_TRICO